MWQGDVRKRWLKWSTERPGEDLARAQGARSPRQLGTVTTKSKCFLARFMERPDSVLAQALGAKENFRSKSLWLRSVQATTRKQQKALWPRGTFKWYGGTAAGGTPAEPKAPTLTSPTKNEKPPGNRFRAWSRNLHRHYRGNTLSGQARPGRADKKLAHESSHKSYFHDFRKATKEATNGTNK